MPLSEDPGITEAFAKMGLESARRHVFLCVGPDCCATRRWACVLGGPEGAPTRPRPPVSPDKGGLLPASARAGPGCSSSRRAFGTDGVTPERLRADRGRAPRRGRPVAGRSPGSILSADSVSTGRAKGCVQRISLIAAYDRTELADPEINIQRMSFASSLAMEASISALSALSSGLELRLCHKVRHVPVRVMV